MADDPTLAELRDQAAALGLPTYGTKAQIAERIAEHEPEPKPEDVEPQDAVGVAADDQLVVGGDIEAAEIDVEDEDEPEPEPPAEPSEQEPMPIRAGGWIDRHDGRGWVLDTKEH